MTENASFYKDFEEKEQSYLDVDGVPDMPPPNMVPWHMEYYKMKEFEKMAAVGRSL